MLFPSHRTNLSPKQRLRNFLSRFQILSSKFSLQENLQRNVNYFLYLVKQWDKYFFSKLFLFLSFSSILSKTSVENAEKTRGVIQTAQHPTWKYRTPCPIPYKNVNQTQPVKAPVLFCSIPGRTFIYKFLLLFSFLIFSKNPFDLINSYATHNKESKRNKR